MEEEKVIYQCGECSSAFRHKQDLLHHFKTTHLEISPCSECSNRSQSNMWRHRSRAHGIDTFTCEFCKSSFKCKENLARHMKDVHLSWGGSGFKCDFCGKIFKLKNNLKIHLLVVHLETDASGCWYCKKVFKRKADMKKHVKYVHNDIKNFECSLCNGRFGVKSTATKHVQRHYRKTGIVLCKEEVESLIVRLNEKKQRGLQ